MCYSYTVINHLIHSERTELKAFPTFCTSVLVKSGIPRILTKLFGEICYLLSPFLSISTVVSVYATASRPAWARGLKQKSGVMLKLYNKSRPAWARGLKLL